MASGRFTVGRVPALDAPASHSDATDVPLALALLLAAIAVNWMKTSTVSPSLPIRQKETDSGRAMRRTATDDNPADPV